MKEFSVSDPSRPVPLRGRRCDPDPTETCRDSRRNRSPGAARVPIRTPAAFMEAAPCVVAGAAVRLAPVRDGGRARARVLRHPDRAECRDRGGIWIGHFGGIELANCRMGEGCTVGQQTKVGCLAETDGPQIGNGVWIGAHARICGRIRIGDGATIAPGARVVEDVPSRSLVVGAPAARGISAATTIVRSFRRAEFAGSCAVYCAVTRRASSTGIRTSQPSANRRYIPVSNTLSRQ